MMRGATSLLMTERSERDYLILKINIFFTIILTQHSQLQCHQEL